MNKIIWNFIVFRVNIYRANLYLCIIEIQFWYECTESKEFREEHIKPLYNMQNNQVI
jgi:hypothetical protein